MSSRPCSEERVINIQLGGCGLAKSSRKREEQRDLYIGTIMRQITPAVRTASFAGYARIFVMLGIKRKKKEIKNKIKQNKRECNEATREEKEISLAQFSSCARRDSPTRFQLISESRRK